MKLIEFVSKDSDIDWRSFNMFLCCVQILFEWNLLVDLTVEFGYRRKENYFSYMTYVLYESNTN